MTIELVKAKYAKEALKKWALAEHMESHFLKEESNLRQRMMERKKELLLSGCMKEDIESDEYYKVLTDMAHKDTICAKGYALSRCEVNSVLAKEEAIDVAIITKHFKDGVPLAVAGELCSYSKSQTFVRYGRLLQRLADEIMPQ